MFLRRTKARPKNANSDGHDYENLQDFHVDFPSADASSFFLLASIDDSTFLGVGLNFVDIPRGHGTAVFFKLVQKHFMT